MTIPSTFIVSPHTHDKMLDCRKYISDRWSHEIKTSGRGNRDWISSERAAIAEAASQWAENHGYELGVSASDVEQIEPLAVGHSDYFDKLSLYVAQFVVYEQAAA